MRFYRRLSICKIHSLFWIIFLTSIALYLELFSYKLNTYNWHVPKCQNSRICSKILLVADPQIIGNTMENIHFITPISIFDSDRYLAKTYALAYDSTQPDIVIFLGDLMDEGHIATNQDFHEYVRRIFNIYLDKTNSQMHVKHIWLPGDNDVGGEDSLLTEDKVKRFERAFSQPSMMTIRNITFFKINKLTLNIPVYKKQRDFYTDEPFIGLSHVPMMFKPSAFVDKVISKMLPQVMFTAHEHKSMIISTDASLRQDFHIMPVTADNSKVYKFTLGESDMYEIIIPTCSYRMGTDKIGYGYAIIENDVLQFTVLWSPSRFSQLLVYLIVFLIFFVYLIVMFSLYHLHKFSSNYQKFINSRV